MILIPQRLFGDKRVTTIFRDGNVCVLSKELNESIVDREGYISNHVVCLLLSGEQRLKTYDEQFIKVKAGEVLFIPRGMYYVSDLIPRGGTFKSLLFYFDEGVIRAFLSTAKVDEVSDKKVPSHLKFDLTPPLRLFANSLIDIYQHNTLRNKSFLQLKILELLYLLNGPAQEQKLADFFFRLTLPKKRNIKDFMENNFDKPLKVEDYAYLTGRSLSTFRRDFKSFFHITPQRWLKEKRLEKAIALLHEKEISVTDLAYEVGYENISYFIKAFKNKVGQSPKQYILSLYRNRIH